MLEFLKRKLDFHEPEVIHASITTLLFLISFLLIDLFDVFFCHISEVQSLLLTLIGGLLSLLGFSITGIAIVISWFSAHDIKFIEELKTDSFSEILDTFKDFAYDMVINIVLFLLVYLLTLSDLPRPEKFLFYIFTAVLSYLFLYILFYGWALLQNCITLSNLKKLINESATEDKSKFDILNEVALEQLVEIIYRGSHQDSKSFYESLLKMIKDSSIPQKNELVEYIRCRYLGD